MKRGHWWAGIIAASFACPVVADWSGLIELETRVFDSSPAYSGQRRDSVLARVKGLYTREWGEGKSVFTFSPFARLDSGDSDRNSIDIDELGWTHLMEGMELRLGARKVFWGVAESNHLVDIVNQTDLVDNPDGESKLSQPMINLALFFENGTLDLFVLPGFRNRAFPGTAGRLRGPLSVGDAAYESGLKNRHIDFAGRFSHKTGAMDIALSGYSGTSREPNFTITPDASKLIADYPLIRQLGLELSYIADRWIWKMEAIGRRGKEQSFHAGVGGFEYTFYGISDSPADMIVFCEYSRDERELRSTFGMDNDLFLGVRANLNDSSNSAFMLGLSHDLDGHGDTWMIEGSTRMGSDWRIGIEGRLFRNIDAEDALFSIRHDSYLQLTVEAYF